MDDQPLESAPQFHPSYPQAHLLSIPPELRQQILGYFLTGSIHFVADSVQFSPVRVPRKSFCSYCLGNGCPFFRQYLAHKHFHALDCAAHDNISVTPLQVQILLVCRQLYEEGRDALYRSEFVFRDAKHFSDFPKHPEAGYGFLRPVRKAMLHRFQDSVSRSIERHLNPQEIRHRFPNLELLTVIMVYEFKDALVLDRTWFRGLLPTEYWLDASRIIPARVEFKITVKPAPAESFGDKGKRERQEEIFQSIERTFQRALDQAQSGVMETQKVVDELQESYKRSEIYRMS